MSVPDDQPHTRTRYPAGEAPPDAAAGRHPLRTLAAVLGAVVILLVVVAVINRTSGSTQAGASTGGTSGATGTGPAASGSGAQATATAPTGTQPVSTSQDGIATGFPHTAEGAQSAAVNYSVALGSSEMYTTASRHAIVATVADPASASTLLAKFDPAFTSLAGKLGLKSGQAQHGLTFISRTIPVGTKIDTYSGSQATVEIWNDSIGGLAGQGSTNPVTEYWYTLTLKLAWVDNDWKVTDFSQVDGPTPISGTQTSSSAEAITNAVTQFGGFRYAR